ncbi:MAG: helix-turn-helix transcriptional regulator [Anaerocolumna aminovalerica]|uniref:helix-turn-helix domain-containing protein n=1 Tax=Anaerocolumna aminovalerica TaxID=1527 RepID=UPI0029133E00|nr:helix-turn-helix transcriptional regulator [Anaerocolumna aminovalerica]MDU6263732.1 helix-turn-helix transcriptional regulator [Anaerocolumna aminovalerica]
MAKSKFDLNPIEQIKLILSREKMTVTDLAKLMGTTRQNLHNKFDRGSLNSKDMEKIADVLGCDLEITFIKKRPIKQVKSRDYWIAKYGENASMDDVFDEFNEEFPQKQGEDIFAYTQRKTSIFNEIFKGE